MFLDNLIVSRYKFLPWGLYLEIRGVEVASVLILRPKFTELGEISVRLEMAGVGSGDWTLSEKIILTSSVSS